MHQRLDDVRPIVGVRRKDDRNYLVCKYRHEQDESEPDKNLFPRTIGRALNSQSQGEQQRNRQQERAFMQPIRRHAD